MGKNSFVLYHDYAEHFGLLSDAQLGRLLRALMVYEMEEREPQFEGALKMAFSFVRANLDRDREKWLEKSRINSENGAKGGRPRKQSGDVKSDGFLGKAEKGVNVTVTDIVTGTVNATATVMGDKEKNIKKEKPPKR